MSKTENAVFWVMGYLHRKPRKISAILRDSPFPERFTRMALDTVAYSTDGELWDLQENYRRYVQK